MPQPSRITSTIGFAIGQSPGHDLALKCFPCLRV
jgi:hypothetical protein